MQMAEEPVIDAMDLFGSVVANVESDTLRDLIQGKVPLTQFDFIQEVLSSVDAQPDILDKVSRYSVYHKIEEYDPAKAQVIVNMPGGMEWIGLNIDAVRQFLQERADARAKMNAQENLVPPEEQSKV